MSNKYTNQIILQACNQLGVSDNSALVYDFFIKFSTKSISDCAQNIGISRQQVYKSLNELFEHRLISKLDEKNTKEFSVRPPSYLLSLVKSKNVQLMTLEKELKENLHWLNTPFDTKKIKIIDTIKDKYEFRTLVIDKYSNSKQTILYFGSTSSYISIIGAEIIDKLIDLRIKNSTNHHIISTDNILSELDNQKFLRYIKEIKPSQTNTASYNVFDDCVIFWNDKIMGCIVIYDIAIVNVMRFNFEMMWGLI
jgi:sugar-specific transcriptional regulator TrmB